jgi:hypothetical protein
MIFAFGSQRSGTFWLQRIITAHPEISDVPSETELFSSGIAPLFERFHHGVRSSPSVGQLWVEREVLLDAARDFCDRVLEPHLAPGARLLSERTPAHSGAVGLIREVYPDAKLVHIIRDGRDVARSLAAQDWGPAGIAEAARVWRDAVSAARAEAPAEGYLEVRYEELLADPRGGAAALYGWLGLPVDDAIVDQAAAVAGRVINQDSGDGRIVTQKWRDHFSPEDLAAFEAEAGELLAELGYADGAPPRRRTLGALLRPRPAPATAPPSTLIGSLPAAQRVADRFLGALHAGAEDEVLALLADTATLRRVSPEADDQVVGSAASARGLLDDPAWRGRQLSGNQHPGVPTYVLVLRYDVPGSGPAWRVLALAIREERVQGVTLYSFPAHA